MKILLIGEYSRLHNSLKEGLQALGHEVFLVGMGDAFKNYPVDYNYDAKTSNLPYLKLINKIFSKILKEDLHTLERGIRFFKILPKLKNYDVVHLINETPIQTFLPFEQYLLNKLIKQNKKTFLLSCGTDVPSVNFAWNNGFRYSFLDVYKKDQSLHQKFRYALRFLEPKFRNHSEQLYKKINGVCASDLDYAIPLKNHPKFLGLIPNPVNTDKIKLEYNPIKENEKIIIFLGINRLNAKAKGIEYFEDALKIINDKFKEKVEVIITENLPYTDYINIYNKCHILLDQVFAYDQGYNALEAMAKGKVVFTGAEKEFLEHYNLQEDQVAINTLPEVNHLVNKLTELIENPIKINQISNSARDFIIKNHHYISIAEKYLDKWK